MNDYNDQEADAINGRKGNYLFGAKAPRAHLDGLLQKIALVTTPFIIIFTYLSGIKMLLLLTFMIVVNIAYNFRPFRIKERPPFEILIQVGYIMTAFGYFIAGIYYLYNGITIGFIIFPLSSIKLIFAHD